MSGSIRVTPEFDPSNLSAFGTLETADLTPSIQFDFVHGINSQTGVATTANSATVDTNSGRLRLQSGTNAAGSAIFNSKRVAKYRAGQGMVARFTAAFTAGVASSTQIVGMGNAVDGFFVGFNGTVFGVCHRNGSVDTWTPQESWNGDKADGTGPSGFNLDETLGNVFMIKYPYLGYGDINFFVEDSVSGRFILIHTIRYANSSAATQVTNPNLQFYAQSVNSGNTSNLIVYSGSVGVFLSGARSFTNNPKWAADNNKTGITSETNVLSIRNATTYNGSTNRSLIRLNSVSIATQNNLNKDVCTVRFRIGATVGGSPSFAAISGTTADGGVTITSGNSVASSDTAGTSVSGGTLVFNIALTSGTSQIIDLTPFDLTISPADILTISANPSGSMQVSVALNWTEDI